MYTPTTARICLLRFSALGDLSHVLPLARALLDYSPQLQLDWIIDSRCAGVIPTIPGLRLLPFDKTSGWRGLRALRQQLRGIDYDAALLLQTSVRANLVSTLIKARRRIGWDPGRAREAQALVQNERIEEQPPQHQVQGFLAFARHLGADAREPSWDIGVSTDSAAFAEQHLPGDQPTLMISPCSSHPTRNWRAGYYAEVADWAQAQYAMRVAVIGGPGATEQAMATAIQQHARAPIVNLVGKDTLPRMLALLQRATVILAPDSGPLHWANALGRPVVGLYASTWSQRSGPYNSLDLCVDRFAEAARRFRRREPGQLRWGSRIEHSGVMDLVEVTAVCEKLAQALARDRSDR